MGVGGWILGVVDGGLSVIRYRLSVVLTFLPLSITCTRRSDALGHAIIMRGRCGPGVVSTSGVGILPEIRRPTMVGGNVRCTATLHPIST